MKLENTFTIPVPADQAWPVLLDLERLAPCVPGATITAREGDDYHGRIKVKLGPVGLSYKGVIQVVSQDRDEGVAVFQGSGRENRGNGTAKAVITCRLAESDGVTTVFVDTDLAVTGKPAQFGRGALAEVAGTLIGAFADNLAAELTAAELTATELTATQLTDPPATGSGRTTPGGVTGAPADRAATVSAGAAAASGAGRTSPGRPAPTAAADDASPESAGKAAGGAATATSGTGVATPGASVRPITPRRGAEPIDLVAAAGITPVHRAVVAVAALLGAAALFALARRRRCGRARRP
ncbi:SRPBCC family protein [Nocardia farcinica]|uniref:SRPBCC family protein n=1 Tax=Nocardia farcinica TaxID=37329 RepID=UPI0024538FF7|nr:SRPBCC family protein [Nocardia farcinica]